MNQQKAHDTKHFANFKNVGYLRVLYGRKEFLIYIVFDVINGLLFDVDWGVYLCISSASTLVDSIYRR